jgi:hypothetical protein
VKMPLAGHQRDELHNHCLAIPEGIHCSGNTILRM